MSEFDESDDDFLIDEELQEIEKQLMADADHMHSLYPSMNSNRLDDLVSRCLVAAENSAANHMAADHLTADGSTTDVAKVGVANAKDSHSKVNKPARSNKWIPFSTAVSLCLILGCLVYVWSQPGNNESDQTADSTPSDSGLIVTRPVSIKSMPREILNASQPELEAIYDMMPNESISVEF